MRGFWQNYESDFGGLARNGFCDGEESGKSWRAHREIKGYAGGSEHRTVADECMDAAGNGAADESNDTATDTGKSDGCGASAASGERYDGTAGVAAGASTKVDGTFLPPGYGRGLHEAEEPSLESDCALYAD